MRTDKIDNLLFLLLLIIVTRACNWGEYLNTSSGTCQLCSQPCLICVNTEICNRCKDHYYVKDSKCLPCEWPCESCIDVKDVCSRCVYHVDDQYYGSWSWYWMEGNSFRYRRSYYENNVYYYRDYYFFKDSLKSYVGNYTFGNQVHNYYYYYNYQDIPFNQAFYKDSGRCYDVKMFIYKRYYNEHNNPKQKAEEQIGLILSVVLGGTAIILLAIAIYFKISKKKAIENQQFTQTEEKTNLTTN